MLKQTLTIESVAPGSIADEMEIEGGDRLIAINGHHLRDIIDYTFYSAAEEDLLLEIAKPDGEIWEIEIERDPAEPLGLYFPPPQPAHCRNNCLFCFVHQLPKGLRKPLYIKDEDYRLSFLNGNYVTLANLKPNELSRIIEQRLSPLYISVHATNPDLRQKLLGREKIPAIMDQLRQLAGAGISLHTQVVLCPGINDAKELEQTVSDLASLYPSVQSIAVVPLGLTVHRNGLPRLQPVDSEFARDFIRQWQPRAAALAKRLGEPFLFLADEFYLKAQLPFPSLKSYGDLPQIENGVGMVPLFLADAAKTIRSVKAAGDLSITVVTGQSAYPFVADFLNKLTLKTGIRIRTAAIENQLFGSSVTVSGLVSGGDIIRELIGSDCGEAVLVPDVMIKEGEGVFLDDVSITELEKQLGVQVVVFEATPQGCWQAIRALARKKPSGSH